MYVMKARGKSSRLRKAAREQKTPTVNFYHFFGILALIQERGFYYFMKAVDNEKKIHVP